VSGLVLSDYRRLVVKVGSSLLVDENGQLDRAWLEKLASDFASLASEGHEILIVSSGAIAIGSSVLGINKKRARLEDLQAAAAAGQVQLVHAYQEALRSHDIVAAQVLLTPDDTEDRRRFLNARRTLGKLIERSVIPVINENDTVATTEIRYGDNDRLAARIAQLVMADALVLLSDVDGFYTADPGANENAEHIPEVYSENGRRDALGCWHRWHGDQGAGRQHRDARRLFNRDREWCHSASSQGSERRGSLHDFSRNGHAGCCAQTMAGWRSRGRW